MSASQSLSLTPDEEIELAKKVLSTRQFQCWYAFDHQHDTQYAISCSYGIKLMTVRREIERARQKMTDAIAEVQAVRREGKLRVGITIVEGGSAKFAPDDTLDAVIQSLQHQHLARAA